MEAAAQNRGGWIQVVCDSVAYVPLEVTLHKSSKKSFKEYVMNI